MAEGQLSLLLLRHPSVRVVNMTLCLPLPSRSLSLSDSEKKIKSQPLLRRDQRVTEAVEGLCSFLQPFLPSARTKLTEGPEETTSPFSSSNRSQTRFLSAATFSANDRCHGVPRHARSNFVTRIVRRFQVESPRSSTDRRSQWTSSTCWPPLSGSPLPEYFFPRWLLSPHGAPKARV